MQQFTYGKTTFGDHPVDEYIASLGDAERAVIAHIYDLASELVPTAEQGVSYGMPCLKFNGKGLVSVMVTKKFLSLYPFSGLEAVIGKDELAGFETTTGSIHFSADHPIPDALLRKIITARADRITG